MEPASILFKIAFNVVIGELTRLSPGSRPVSIIHSEVVKLLFEPFK